MLATWTYHNVANIIDHSTAQALRNVDVLTDLFQLRADYEWFKAMVALLLPLGLSEEPGHGWADEQYVRMLGKTYGLDHLTDALIDELRSSRPRV